MSQLVAWMNGQLIPADQLAVSYADLGVVAGASVTEMARTCNRIPFRLPHHLDRLLSSLRQLRFPQTYSGQQLMDAVQSVLETNKALCPGVPDFGIVIFSTAGSNPTYLGHSRGGSTTAVHTFPLPFHLWKNGFQKGVRLTIPGQRQLDSADFPVSVKTRNRLHWWLADQQAEQTESGSRALLLDDQGYVTETSTSCFHAVIDQTIVTSDRGVLKSLSSKFTEELAASLMIPFRRRPLHRDELQLATEAFVTSTPSGPLPVYSINRQPVGSQCPGPVWTRLLDAWCLQTRTDFRQQMLTEPIGTSSH